MRADEVFVSWCGSYDGTSPFDLLVVRRSDVFGWFSGSGYVLACWFAPCRIKAGVALRPLLWCSEKSLWIACWAALGIIRSCPQRASGSRHGGGGGGGGGEGGGEGWLGGGGGCDNLCMLSCESHFRGWLGSLHVF